MEEVTDKIISEVKLWMAADQADGGIADLFTINSVYFGDPGVLPVYAYPAVTVQGTRDTPQSETTGAEMRDLTILVSIMIDAREFFAASVEEATGDRDLTRAAGSLRRWLRRDSNRSLDGTVRQLKVLTTDYVPEVRGEIITKSAQLTLVVNKQYQRQQ
jgi:hypothetical protein